MVEKICWLDGFSCDAQLSSPRLTHSGWNFLMGQPPHRVKVSSIDGDSLCIKGSCISVLQGWWRGFLNRSWNICTYIDGLWNIFECFYGAAKCFYDSTFSSDFYILAILLENLKKMGWRVTTFFTDSLSLDRCYVRRD